MVSRNVVNPNKKENTDGNVFNIFYPDIQTAYFFDKDLTEPIIWGSKLVVMTQIKKLDVLMNKPKDFKVKIFSYIMTNDGYRRIDTYHGPIETIGKYIRHY